MLASEALPATDGPSTNVQEPGVDEPDLVKSDGRRLVTVADRVLQVVDVTGEAPVRVGQVDLGEWSEQLLLAGDRVVSFSQASYPADAGPGQHVTLGTRVTVVDLANPAAPAVIARLSLEGGYVTARLVDGLVRLVVHSRVAGPAFVSPKSEADQARTTDLNRRAVETSTVEDWLPEFTLDRPDQPRVNAPLVSCTSVFHPEPFAGLDMATVVTIDPEDPLPTGAASVLGGASTVYASPRNVFVASTTWVPWDQPTGAGPTTTQLHQFAIEGRQPARFVASGEVPGHLLDQFSLSEHEGHLRVASTVLPVPAAPGANPQSSESLVTVLALTSPRLTRSGQVGGLGPGERIYAVRFLGDVGYVVTYRQVDPLYVLDLGDPSRPALRGELKVPGFSSYLHPVSDSLLLGVGQDTADDSRPLGTQLSAFDVSDPAAPVRRHAATLSGASSEAEHDHHAFMWWPDTQLLVIPLQDADRDPDPANDFSGAVALRWDPTAGFSGETRLRHPVANAPIRRSLVVQGALVTVSKAGVMTSDLATLAPRGWAPFGAEPPPAGTVVP